MNKDELETTLRDLAAGRLSPEEWAAWWESRGEAARALLSAGEYLRLQHIWIFARIWVGKRYFIPASI